MKIKQVEFVGSVGNPEQSLPSSLPQIAFSGRSNVGKSSLINTILGRTRKGVARVSGKPGKTRTLNFFEVNDRFALVDLPGFGYAAVPDAMRDSWKQLIEGYLARPDGPRGIVHLVDSRHDPTRTDREMVSYLAGLGLPTLLVLTKIDKLNRSQRKGSVARAAEALEVDPEQILPFSSKTGEGKEMLLEALDQLLEATAASDSPPAPTVGGEEVPTASAPGAGPAALPIGSEGPMNGEEDRTE